MIRLDEDRLRVVLRELRGSTAEMLRSLGALGVDDLSAELRHDLLGEAIRHARHLETALGSLEDLADLAAEAPDLDLQELDLHRLVRQRLELGKPWLGTVGIQVRRRERRSDHDPLHPLIGDPQRIARLVDLSLQVAVAWARPRSQIAVVSEHSRIAMRFSLDGEVENWYENWWKGTADWTGSASDGLLEALLVPGRAFRRDTVPGLQRIHEIARRHGGSVDQELEGSRVTLTIRVPVTDTDEALFAALASRLRRAPTGVATLALIVLAGPRELSVESYGRRVRSVLARANDSIFLDGSAQRTILLVNDCSGAEARQLVNRLSTAIGPPEAIGIACCPEDASDPSTLLSLANHRLDLPPPHDPALTPAPNLVE